MKNKSQLIPIELVVGWVLNNMGETRNQLGIPVALHCHPRYQTVPAFIKGFRQHIAPFVSYSDSQIGVPVKTIEDWFRSNLVRGRNLNGGLAGHTCVWSLNHHNIKDFAEALKKECSRQ